MISTSILLKSVRSGILLGPQMFEGIDINTILSNRDESVFETEWLRLFSKINAIVLTADEAQEINELREVAFKSTFKHLQDPEVAGYVSDDFEVIGKGLVGEVVDSFLSALFAAYINGKIPGGKVTASFASLPELLSSLRKKLVEKNGKKRDNP